MTARLVTLMTVVLMLSLGAFWLLLGHSREAILEEVGETASAAGTRALRAVALRSGTFVGAGAVGESQRAPLSPTRTVGAPIPDDEHGGESGALVILAGGSHGAPGAHTGAGEVHARLAQRLGPVVRETRIVVDAGDLESGDAAPFEVTCEPEGEGLEASGTLEYFVIHDGMFDTELAQDVLHVRMLVEARAAVVAARVAGDTAEDGDAATGAEWASASDPVEAALAGAPALQEFSFEVPTAQYQAIFDAVRDRTLFLGLGVLALGTVLSVGVARRFTRPVRQLDAGLRKLSSGDLDVEVDERGSDEIARLGRAFNDMTRRLRQGRERARELTRREKLSALGRLAAGVAHDVRNPLQSINLTLQHLQETARPTEAARTGEFDRSLALIRGEVERLDRQVRNFLRFARAGGDAKQSVALADVLRETADLVRKEAEWRGIAVVVEAGVDLPEVEVDVESLRAALLNLVLNGFEAMPGGGTVTMRALAADEGVALEVADTGAGIPAENHEKVFEFGFTTRDGGHGFGLAMVHQVVVEEHGGRVRLESRSGAGTTIRLDLPCRAAPARADVA